MTVWTAIALVNVLVVLGLLGILVVHHRRPHVGEGDEPLVRAGLRGLVRLEARDVALVLVLVLFAFDIRILSPIVVNVGGSGPARQGVAIVGEQYPHDTTECSEVPVPPASAPKSKITTATGPNGKYQQTNVCGFIFDELYFTVDAADDSHQPAVSYFDPEPPLTKLLIAPPENLFGDNPWTWRTSTTIFGSLLAGMLYLVAMRLRRDRFFATVCGVMVCIDGLTFVESRTGVIDIIAIFFVALVYYIFLLHWQARTHRQWRNTLYLLAVAMGLAFACKLTAVAPLVFIAGLIGMRFAEPLLLRRIPVLWRLRARGGHEPSLWREAATSFRATQAGYARGPVLLGTQWLVMAQAVIAIFGGLALGLLALTRLLQDEKVAKITTPPIYGGYIGLGALLVGVGALLLWSGLRLQDLLKTARWVAVAVEGAVLVCAVLFNHSLLGAVVALSCVVALYALVVDASVRREYAGVGVPLPGFYRDGVRTAVHYVGAVLLVGLIFASSYSRYLTITHNDVYHFTSGCNGAVAGVPVASIETIPPALQLGDGHLLFKPSQALYNIADKFMADLKYQEEECHPHPYASHWYTWPLMEHPVLFYETQVETIAATNSVGIASVTNMGNPAIWWLGIFAILMLAWRMTAGPAAWRVGVSILGVVSLSFMIIGFVAGQSPSYDDVIVHTGLLFILGEAGMALYGVVAVVSGVISRRFVPAFIVGGYEVAWMMWVPGNKLRVLFFYHALGMFLLMVLAIGYLLSMLRRSHVQVGDRSVSLAPVAWGLLVTMVAAFIFFYPVWTAIPLPAADNGMRLWTDQW